MWNPEADIGDVEEWERIQAGFIYLARKIRSNTAGYGERRGGSGYAHVAVFFGSDENVIQNLNMGKAFTGTGLYGGYPSATAYTLLARGVNFEQLTRDKAPYPLSDDPMKPEFEEHLRDYCKYIERLDWSTHFPRMLAEGDIYYFKQNGGPGYGDPLDRPLELCEDDLNEGVYTPEIMERVYGVKASYDEKLGVWRVDKNESEKLREKIKKERLERALNFAEFYREEREIILGSQFTRPVARMYQEQKEVSPRWWKEFTEFWQIPEDFIPEADELDEYFEKVLQKHRKLVDGYRSFLKEAGYDIEKVRHVYLEERR
jgi:N-methylhydantoinase B/acetone carboxylase alpha subunit